MLGVHGPQGKNKPVFFPKPVRKERILSLRHYRSPAKQHRRLGQHYEVVSTCYSQGTTTASGAPVYLGEVANNFLAFGTRIRLEHPVFGRSVFTVEDRIGWGSELDIYNSSEASCSAYGRQEVGFWVLR